MAIKFLNDIESTGEVQGTSLDINGNADISGNLTLSGGSSIIDQGTIYIQDTAAGRIGWNRNTSNGAIHNSGYNAFQAQVHTSGANGKFEIQAYTGSGSYGGSFLINVNAQPLINDYILHNGDENTKIGFSGADTFLVHVGGGDRLKVETSGTVLLSDGGNADGSVLYLKHPNNNTTDTIASIFFGNNADTTLSAIVTETNGANNTSNLKFRTSNAGTIGTALTLNADNSATFAENVTVSGSAGNGSMAVNSAGACQMDMLNAQSEAYLRTITNHDLHFRTNNTNRMVIKTTGKVGIGTASPSDKLEVYSNGADVALRIHEDAGTHQARLHLRRGGSDWEIINDNHLIIEGEGVERFRINTSGNTTIAGSISTPSSFNFTNNTAQIKVGSNWNTGVLNFLNGATTYLTFDVPNGRIQNNLGSYLTASSGTAKFGSFDNQSMSLVTNNTARLTIDTSGNADFAGTLRAKGNIEVKDSDGSTALSHGRLNSNGNEGYLTVSNGSNWGLIARGPANEPRLGAWYGGVLKIEGMHSSDGQPGSNSIDFAQFHFGNNHFQMNAATSAFAGDVSLGTGKSIYLNGSTNGLRLLHDGSNALVINQTTGDLKIQNSATDKDIIFRGKDGASSITALTLDMSDGGWATFNSGIHVANTFSPSTFGKATFAGDITTSGNIILSGAANEIIKSNGSIRLNIDSDNNQTDRIFIVSHHSNAELFKVDESGNGTFSGSVISTDGSDTTTLSHTGLVLSRSNSYIQSNADNSDTLNIGQSSVRWGNVKVDGATFKVLNGGNERFGIDSSGNATFAGSVYADGGILVGQTSAYSPTGGGDTLATFTGSGNDRQDIVVSNQTNHASAAASLVLATHGHDFIIKGTSAAGGSVLSLGFNTNPFLSLTSSNATFGGTITLPSSNTLTGSSGKVAFNGRVSGSTPTGTTDFTTKAYVDLQVSNLVDSAPSTLNTLNELAAALGDDVNFSTTVTNSIAAKLPLAGGTMSGAIAMGSQNITGVASLTAQGISASSAVTTPTIQLQGDLNVLNKAQSSYLTLADRDTSGSEVVYNLDNIGTLTASGKILATVNSGTNFEARKGGGTGAVGFGGTAHQTGLIEGVDGGGLKLYTAGNDVDWGGSWTLNTTWSGTQLTVAGELEAGSLDINGNADISGNLNFANNKGLTWAGSHSVRIEGNVLKMSASSGIQLQNNTGIIKNSPRLELGTSNVTTGNAEIRMFSKNGSNANAYYLKYNKDTNIDRLEFIDGSGNANIQFNNGGSATFAGSLTIPDYINHAGDSGTKFGFDGNDTFVVRTGGAVRLTVTDTDVTTAQNFTSSGYVQSTGLLYLRNSIQVLNKATNGWLNLAARDTSGSEAVYNLDNIGSAAFAGTITVGADDTGHDVKFFGATSGASFLYDESEDGVVITHPTDETGLGIYTISGGQPTVPQLQIGRSTAQYWGAYTDDRIAHLVHRQDETSGALSTYFEQWDSNTSDTTGNWLWRFGDGSGGNMATALTLTQGGDLTLVGDIYHSGDSDTKIGFSAANTFEVQTGGSARLTVNDSTATFAGDIYTKNLKLGNGSTDSSIQLDGDFGGGDLTIQNLGNDKDILFKGNDNGSTITALTLDMSSGGNAVFAGVVSVPSGKSFRLYNSAGSGWGELTLNETVNKIQFNRGIQPSGDNQSDQLLGTASKRWHTVNAGAIVATDVTASNSVTAGAFLKFGTNGNSDVVNIGSGDIRFLPSSQTLALTLSGANAVFAGTIGSGAITSTGKITGTELEGTSLDINGNADISGNLTGVDTLTATTLSVTNYGLASSDIPNNAANTSGNAATATTATNANNVKTTSVSNSAEYFGVFVDANGTAYQDLHVGAGLKYNPSTNILTAGKLATDTVAIVENAKSTGPDGTAGAGQACMTITGAGAGNESNISLKIAGTAHGSPAKLKIVAETTGGDPSGNGLLSYHPTTDTFGIGQTTTHNSMAILIDNNDVVSMKNQTTFTNGIDVTSAVQSTSKTTGTVKIAGGVGISKTLNVGEDVVAYASSDERYKDNLKPITSPIDKVKSLTGYTFTWNDKHEQFNGNNDIGVVAQEVEKILPEIVDTRDDGYKAVKYEKMVALLIEAVKDQQTQIDDLKTIIDGYSK